MEDRKPHPSAREDGKTPKPDTALLTQAADWMLRLDMSPDDPDLRAELDAWLQADVSHRRAWERINTAWDMVAEVSVPGAHRPEGPAPARPQTTGRLWPFSVPVVAMALAACLVLALLPVVWPGWQADYETAVGEVLSLELEDGTRVILGADTALIDGFSEKERRVRLQRGEAFFEVGRDPVRPFVVEVGDMTVRDIGTAFDVRADGPDYAVSVREGAVAVTYPDGEHQLLPGDRLELDRKAGRVRRGHLPPGRIATWLEGRLFVQDRTVASLVGTLERYIPGYILVMDSRLSARRVTGSYNLNDPDGALSAIVQPYGGRVLHLTPLLRIVLGPA